jgi:hypothetical protein
MQLSLTTERIPSPARTARSWLSLGPLRNLIADCAKKGKEDGPSALLKRGNRAWLRSRPVGNRMNKTRLSGIQQGMKALFLLLLLFSVALEITAAEP